MTPQEIYDKSVKGILKQGRLSYDKKWGRYYMKKNGKILKCAVGHLIPYNKYDPSMEGLDVMEPTVRKIVEELVGPQNMKLVRELQVAHDDLQGCPNWKTIWKERMRIIAAQFDLSDKALKGA